MASDLMAVRAHPAKVAPAFRRPRLGFLGVGWIGRHRLQAVVESGVAEIAGVADGAASAVGEAVQVAAEAVAAETLDDLLAMDLDGVVIATPSAMHAEQAVAALEQGVAVFCQKPLARTAAETQRIVEAARRADRLLAVDFSYRHVRGVPRMRELICGGELGDVFAVDLVFHNAYGPDKAWFYDPALSGGGCAIDLGIHLVDLALWLTGESRVTNVASRLFSQGRPLSDPQKQVEDCALATWDFAGGATGRLACSWRLSAGCDCVIEASVYGTQGAVSLRNVHGSFYDFRVERYCGTSREVLATPPDAWGGRAVVNWAERLARGERFDAEAEYLINVAAVLDAIYQR